MWTVSGVQLLFIILMGVLYESIPAQTFVQLSRSIEVPTTGKNISETSFALSNLDGFGQMPDFTSQLSIGMKKGSLNPESYLAKFGKVQAVEGINDWYYPVSLALEIPSVIPQGTVLLGGSTQLGANEYSATGGVIGASKYLFEKMTTIAVILRYQQARMPRDYYLNLLRQSVQSSGTQIDKDYTLSFRQIVSRLFIGEINWTFFDNEARPYAYRGIVKLAYSLKHNGALHMALAYYGEEDDLKPDYRHGVITSSFAMINYRLLSENKIPYDSEVSVWYRIAREREAVKALIWSQEYHSHAVGFGILVPLMGDQSVALDVSSMVAEGKGASKILEIKWKSEI